MGSGDMCNRAMSSIKDIGMNGTDDISKRIAGDVCMRACLRARGAFLDFYMRLCEEVYYMMPDMQDQFTMVDWDLAGKFGYELDMGMLQFNIW